MMIRRDVQLRPYICLLACTCSVVALAQESQLPQLRPGSERKPAAQVRPAPEIHPQTIDLIVPKGTPIQVALDGEVRVRKPGQKIHARVIEPVYAFDKLVIPAGTEISGQITQIEANSRGKRTEAALNGDFTPARKVHVEFNDLELKNGKHIPINTTVAPGSGEVLKFSTAGEKEKKNSIKDAASKKASEARQQAKQQWDNTMQQLKAPGKMHRLKRFLEAQLPAHPQYIPAQTTYFATLNEPLNFGREVMTAQIASSIGGQLPPGAVVHARLVTPLTSATAKKDDPVEAVLAQPLLAANRLIFPQGTRLEGTVLQARPARRLKKNGQLRITFRELIPPDGVAEKVQATLESVETGKNGNVKLDSEGGAEATNPKTRYLTTGISLGLAAMSGGGDGDRGNAGSSASGDTTGRAAGGANGFKLIGIALGLSVHSRVLGRAMGMYGAGWSVYSNFLTRGREVVYPKNMAMSIGVGQHAAETSSAPQP